MATLSLFSSAPSFPKDVPVARIAKISLQQLAIGDSREAEAVLAACTSLGFFLLDLHGNATGEELMKDVDGTFKALHETVDMSIEEKMRFSQSAPKCFAG